MSFKRDENDPGPLGALQRRRVAELLASAIPEDEALLLRDGRLACSLCPHRPVCDTLQTLLLHRAGRKHLDSLQRSFGRRQPQVGPQVTPQEAPGVAPGAQAGVAQAPLLARTRRLARSALLPSAPYSSRCRKPTKRSSSQARMIPKNSQEPPKNSGNSQFSEGPGGNSRVSEGSGGNSQFSEGPSPERLRILRYHLDLRSRGWIPDGSGRWIRDADAEFDSDEEEPPPLPPP